MKKAVWIAGFVGMSLLMSGCGGSADSPVPSPNAATSDPNVAGALSTPPDKCLTTINVIGMGDPGPHASATEGIVTDAYKALKDTLLRDASVGKASGVTEDRINLIFPKYDGDSEAIESPVDNPDYNPDGYWHRSLVAGDSVIKAVKDADKACPGSSSVLVGYGFGASAMHAAGPDLVGESAKEGTQLGDHVLGVMLLSDPNRTDQSEMARIDGDNFADTNSPDQQNDNAQMAHMGSRGGTLTDWVRAVFKGAISVCNLHDLQCAFPAIEMTDSKKREAMIASHGGMDAVKKSMVNYVSSVPAMVTATSWVVKNIESAFSAAQKYPAGTKQSDALNKYLQYVNTGHGGATVVQDVFDSPAIVNTCEADYTVIAARGSGEPIEGNSYDKDEKKIPSTTTLDGTIINGGQPAQAGAPLIQGFTEFPATFAWEIKTQLPTGSKIRFVPVDYEAVPIFGSLLPDIHTPQSEVGNWLTNWHIARANPDAYFASANSGTKILTNAILDIEKRCPLTKIIVMGYSQGAQVVHQALSSFSFEQANHVSSVVLIADPLRDKDDPNSVVYDPKNHPEELAQIGSSDLRGGIINGSARLELSGFAIPSSLKDRVIEVCNTDDIVCFAGVGAGIAAHLSAYRLESHYKFPSAWAVYAVKEHDQYKR